MSVSWSQYLYGVYLISCDFATQRLRYRSKSAPFHPHGVETSSSSPGTQDGSVRAAGAEGERGRPKTAIVTGGNTGIGRETVQGLALSGARVVLACRTVAKGDEAVAAIHRSISARPSVRQDKDVDAGLPPAPEKAAIEVEQLDLASFASIRSFAGRMTATLDQLDILVLNAGVMNAPLQSTEDGIPELHFATNHLGHFLLTILLLPLLRRSPSARIVVVNSMTYVLGTLKLDDLEYKTRRYDAFLAYADSKLCGLLFMHEMCRRLRGSAITINAVHPGDVGTSITRNMHPIMVFGHKYVVSPLLLSEEQGAWTSLYAALSPQLEGVSGGLLWRCDEELPLTAAAQSDGDARRLWDVSWQLCRLSAEEQLLLP